MVCDTGVMPQRSSKQTRIRDEVQAAFDTFQQIIKDTEGTGKDPLAVALGRRGGLRGGPARRDALSPARRREIAVKAVKTRWATVRKQAKG